MVFKHYKHFIITFSFKSDLVYSLHRMSVIIPGIKLWKLALCFLYRISKHVSPQRILLFMVFLHRKIWVWGGKFPKYFKSASIILCETTMWCVALHQKVQREYLIHICYWNKQDQSRAVRLPIQKWVSCPESPEPRTLSVAQRGLYEPLVHLH